MVPIEDLAIEHGLNKRFHYGDLQQLADSIKENGVIQPLHVFSKPGDEVLYIMDGHRRFKAAKLATTDGWKGELPVIKWGRSVPTEEEKTLAIITHNGGKPLNLLEEGTVYATLLKLGMSNSEISRKVGKSVTHVISCAGLTDLNVKLIDKIKNGVVTATMVMDELKRFDQDELNELIDQAVETEGKPKVTRKHLSKITTKRETVKAIKESYTVKEMKDKLLHIRSRGRHVPSYMFGFLLYLDGSMSEDQLFELINC